MSRKRVAILISGRGSNMAALIEAAKRPDYPAAIALVVSNRPDAAGIGLAKEQGVATLVLDHRIFGKDRAAFEQALQKALDQHEVELVCLGGFMRLLTDGFVLRWQGRMLNIHPSLLPSFKGLDPHGEALKAGAKIAGATVHFVTPDMDAGPIVAQAAFDEAGPIHGRRLVLKTYDDGTANASTIQVEEKRAKDEAFALLSMVSESNTVLAPLADQHRVPLIVGNADEKVILPLTYAFPVLPFWARQAKTLPGFIQNVLGGGGKRIGIVYEGTSTAIDAKAAFKAEAGQAGLRVVFEQPIAQNQSACANEVANLQAHRVELVFMMNGTLGAICMLRDARALDYHPTWTGVGTSWSTNVVAGASGGGADGIRMLSGSMPLESPVGRRYSELLRNYAPNSGAADDDVMLLYYEILQTFLEGLRRAGPDLTREGFVQTFETAMNGFDSGYLPPPTFGPGNRSGPLAVGVVACCTGGRWTVTQEGWKEKF